MKNFTQLLGRGSVLYALFLSFTLTTYAATVHVAKSGTNALSGRGSSSKPYKTISYLFNNGLVTSGDVILVHEGVYRETVTVNVNNVTIRPRGNDIVSISGANWYGSASWQADNSRPGVFKMTLNKNNVETDFTQLFVNGQHQQIARFPNNTAPVKNYMSGANREMMNPLDQKSGFAVLLNASKPSGANQTGKVTFSWHNGTPKLPNVTFSNEAILRGFIGKLRNNIFSYSQDGGNIKRAGNRLVTFKAFNTQGNNWAEAAAYSAPEGFGYIMDLSVLDYNGEWFYKKTANTLYYKPIGGSMSGKGVEVRQRKYALKVRANNVSIEDIDIKAGEVELKNSSNTSFTRCTFTYMTPFHYRRQYGVFRQGIVLDNADNSKFESCYIGHTWGSGIIILKGSDNTKINNCILEDIGWMGQFTISLENNGNNTQVTNNTFGKASRFHIRTTESVYTKITDNEFHHAMSMGEDAGSIMFTSTGKSAQLNMNGTLIAWNKIHSISGIPAYDTDPKYNRQKVVALYLEDVDNYTVHHNLIYDIKGDSYVSKRLKSNGQPQETQSKGDVMYLGPRNRNLTRKMDYYNNTCWNYDYFMTFWHHSNTPADVNNCNVKNNILMEGGSNSVSAGANSVTESSFYNFTLEVAKSPLNYTISGARNRTVINASDHFVNANNGNYRLKSNSAYNNDGIVISGITTETTPAIGAWEGKANWQRERVFNAGANITSTTFASNSRDITEELEEGTIIETESIVYPNPFDQFLQVSIDPNNLIEGTVEVKLKNVNGNTVLSKSVDSSENLGINTSKLVAGVYFLEVNYKQGQIIRKVIKQ
ncbi:right-handed parallel beta-helix repeat-containing protein [Reichenbachiella versicolor]|uniref:right-handed parallel beta-helix repeat-containing protein n=1 Tax=Reichenbachiella versicolor TaxID=1821036 RepID=UPI000D6DE1C5|nr:right-handed parallel beta-helix repeat-containing protein [Reichenbachiella versicolor]